MYRNERRWVSLTIVLAILAVTLFATIAAILEADYGLAVGCAVSALFLAWFAKNLILEKVEIHGDVLTYSNSLGKSDTISRTEINEVSISAIHGLQVQTADSLHSLGFYKQKALMAAHIRKWSLGA